MHRYLEPLESTTKVPMIPNAVPTRRDFMTFDFAGYEEHVDWVSLLF